MVLDSLDMEEAYSGFHSEGGRATSQVQLHGSRDPAVIIFSFGTGFDIVFNVLLPSEIHCKRELIKSKTKNHEAYAFSSLKSKPLCQFRIHS